MPPADNVAEIGQSYHALYHNVQVRRAYGYGVVSGGQVSPGSTGLSVDVDGGTALFDGDQQSIPPRTDLSIPAPDPSDPRKDLVVYDGTTVDVIVGTAQPAPSDQGSASRFELFQPSPPDTSTTPVVVLAELFVPAGASSLSAADVNDLRTDPSVDADRVSLPDDARLTLGDSNDFTVRYDSDAARLTVDTPGGNTFEYLNDGSLLIDGDLVAEGDVTFGGVFDPDTITPDVVDVGESLELPVYANNANATQDAAEVWFNDGTGPDAAGIYYFDGGVIGPLETGSGSSPGTLSGLTVDVDAKDFDGATFTGMGHDDVDVPQAFDLTVDDFERVSLGSDYVGDTGDAQIQSSVALKGSRSLQISRSSAGRSVVTYTDGTTPQQGDSFRYNGYLTDSNDIFGTAFLVSDPTEVFGSDSLLIRLDASNDQIKVRSYVSGSLEKENSTSADISNNLNEVLTISVEIATDQTTTVRLTDANGNELGQVSHTIRGGVPSSGAVQYTVFNGSTPPTVYFDGPFIDRRVPQETRERQRGSTETSKLQTRGGVGAGPPTASPNQRRRVTHRHPVTTDAQQGERYMDAQMVGGSPVAYVEGQFDGNGGSYADRFQAPLGRFARINANLSFDVPTFSDLPYYGKFASAGTDVTVSLNGLPRELTLSHDGDGSRDGIVRSQMLTNVDTLGPFRIEFSGVNMTKNDTRNRSYVGLYTDDIDSPSNPSSGSGVVFEKRFDKNYLRAIVIENGTTQDVSIITDTMFNGETYAIEMDSDDNISFLRDGEVLHTITESISGPLRPYVNTEDNNNTSVGDSLTVSQITVSPLTEVLR